MVVVTGVGIGFASHFRTAVVDEVAPAPRAGHGRAVRRARRQRRPGRRRRPGDARRTTTTSWPTSTKGGVHERPLSAMGVDTALDQRGGGPGRQLPRHLRDAGDGQGGQAERAGGAAGRRRSCWEATEMKARPVFRVGTAWLLLAAMAPVTPGQVALAASAHAARAAPAPAPHLRDRHRGHQPHRVGHRRAQPLRDRPARERLRRVRGRRAPGPHALQPRGHPDLAGAHARHLGLHGREAAQDAQDAAVRFVRTLRPQDKAQVMQFNDRPTVLQDFTADRPGPGDRRCAARRPRGPRCCTTRSTSR